MVFEDGQSFEVKSRFLRFYSAGFKSLTGAWKMDFDWTKIMEWDELLIVLGLVLLALGYFETGFWITAVGVFLFLATEGYLNF